MSWLRTKDDRTRGEFVEPEPLAFAVEQLAFQPVIRLEARHGLALEAAQARGEVEVVEGVAVGLDARMRAAQGFEHATGFGVDRRARQGVAAEEDGGGFFEV